MRLLIIFATLCLTGLSFAATSTRAENAPSSRTFEVSGVIPAPPEDLWQVLTSSDGWKRMDVPVAVIDFRVGGMIGSDYSRSAHLGQPDNIRNDTKGGVG